MAKSCTNSVRMGALFPLGFFREKALWVVRWMKAPDLTFGIEMIVVDACASE